MLCGITTYIMDRLVVTNILVCLRLSGLSRVRSPQILESGGRFLRGSPEHKACCPYEFLSSFVLRESEENTGGVLRGRLGLGGARVVKERER